MTVLARIGDNAIGNWRLLCNTAAVIFAALCLAFKPRSWVRTVRDQLARQILFTGVEALGVTSLIALLTGISIVTQAEVWLSRFGQSEMLGPLLVATIIREIGPMLVNFLIIGRSGTAIAAEMASMRVREEVTVLDAQGLDPLPYLVMPRLVGMVVSIFCLTIIFVAVCLSSGYFFGFLMGVTSRDPMAFLAGIMKSVSPGDVLNLIAKSTIPGMMTAAISCTEGLRIRGAITEIPQAVTRTVVRSIAAVLIVSVLISVLTYV